MARETPAPAHLPLEAIVDYDYMDGPEIKSDPPSCVDSFREAHRAMYSRLYGGAWILTRFDDIRAVFIDSQNFLQWPDGVPPTPYGAVDIPGHLNPPLHTSYRRLLAPLWSPKRVERLESDVRAVAQRRLSELAPRGHCEFREDFAIRLPAAMFCSLFGLPLDDFQTFERMAADTVYGPARARRVEGEEGAKRVRAEITKTIRRFMANLLEERRANRNDDLISFLLDSKLDDERQLTDDEIVNIAGFFFRAGTDSTAGAITYAFAYLAEHDDLRRQLIDNPAIAENAATELLRLHGFHHIARVAAADIEVAGVTMRKGDIVLLPTGGANHDHRAFEDPTTADFTRKAGKLLTFGAGIHRCIGAGLATMQLRVSLEEVHRAIPDYRRDPTEPVAYEVGMGKAVIDRLSLTYTPHNWAPEPE